MFNLVTFPFNISFQAIHACYLSLLQLYSTLQIIDAFAPFGFIYPSVALTSAMKTDRIKICQIDLWPNYLLTKFTIPRISFWPNDILTEFMMRWICNHRAIRFNNDISSARFGLEAKVKLAKPYTADFIVNLNFMVS